MVDAFGQETNLVNMYGPAFDDSGSLVERKVPVEDVPAFERAGYVKGELPASLKPTPKGSKATKAEDTAKK